MPDQIAADADAFDAWVQQVLRPRATGRLIRSETFKRAMKGVAPLQMVLDRQSTQKEFGLQIWEYLDIAASDERARGGRAMLRKHRALFNRIEASFGVEPEVVAAIWGLETGYGTVRGDVPVLAALATLAWKGRRASFFEDELIAALRLVQAHGFAPARMVGSWAGAMGHGQFMPSSVLDFAVDFDGDGHASLDGDDPSDGLASIANYLKKHGWKRGQPWGVEVRLSEGFDYASAGIDLIRPCADWAADGVRRMDGGALPDYGPASILLPAGARGAALMALRNFHVILRYNRAEAYGIGIGQLADRIAGGKPFAASWPLEERALSADEVAELQYLLTKLGFDTHGIDGLRGPNTTRALRRFQQKNGLVPDGYLAASVLDALRSAK